MEFADQAARDALLHDLDTTFVVEAAAGTGKTTVLVERLVRLVMTGRARLEQVISVTFTEKAAGEMKLRLRTRLERARRDTRDGLELERLTKALEELEVMRIGTIHGLCGDLLREYPVEAGVDPLFEVADTGAAEAMLQTAFQRCFQALLQSQPPGLRRALRRRRRGRDAEPPRLALLAAARTLIDHRDFRAPWRRDPFDRDAEADRVMELLAQFAAFAGVVRPRYKNAKYVDQLLKVKRFIDEVAHRESVTKRDFDGLEAQLKELASDGYGWREEPKTNVSPSERVAELDAAKVAAREALFTFNRRADADLAALLHEELEPVIEHYEAEKKRQGVLDFVDLLLLTRDLLAGHQSVRASLQQRFTHLFVDEFQDTDPLQSEIVLLLCADDAREARPFHTTCVPGKLFVVGDPKQSIYRFRRADILLYERVKQHLIGRGARLEYLSASFRSTPGIQGAVNGAFELAMVGERQAKWVPQDRVRASRTSQPSVVALPAPKPFTAYGRVTKGMVEKHLPDAVGAFIDWLVNESGWRAGDEGKDEPLSARHICILFKRMRGWGGEDMARPYARALEARGVRHVLVGGRSFHRREEVMALRCALLAIERPDDEFQVYATLRGPFFSFTDEQLFAFKETHGKLHPLRPWNSEELTEMDTEVTSALGLLGTLHRYRNRQAVADTVHALLDATRAHAGIAFQTAGEQALANVLQLAELTRGYEARATSFRDVVEALEDEAAEGEAGEAPVVEEGTEGVRMMTVHAAKGLEFPVVILAEPTANAARAEPSHYVDAERGLWVHSLFGCVPVELREHEDEVKQRDAEETLRLTYVAATRAKDLLVVPVCSEQKIEDTWTSPLYPALYPPLAMAHQPKAAPGCPAFGEDVIERDGPLPAHVPKPGLHRSAAGKNGVVWWDVRTLQLDREEPSGLASTDALLDGTDAAARSIEAWETWAAARASAQASGAAPSRRVIVGREMPPVAAPGTLPLEKTDMPRAGRPAGRRFGELVHAVLAVIPLDAGDDAIAATSSVLARQVGATPEEQTACVEAVASALRHPRLTAARASPDVRREVAVVDTLDDGTTVEGVVDLAYELDGTWWVVEFKTDAAIADKLPHYEAQAQAYVRAITAATGKAARGVLLNV